MSRLVRFLVTFCWFSFVELMAGAVWPGPSPKYIKAKEYKPDPVYFVAPRVVMRNPGGETNIRIVVRVKPNAQNRALRLSWQQSYPGEGGGSNWDLDENSPYEFPRLIRHIWVDGQLLIWAILVYDEDGQRKEMLVEHVIEVR